MQKEIKKQIGEFIREARKAKGLTQKELAQKLGVDEQRISKIEGGVVNPTLDTIQKILETLGVSVSITLNN